MSVDSCFDWRLILSLICTNFVFISRFQNKIILVDSKTENNYWKSEMREIKLHHTHLDFPYSYWVVQCWQTFLIRFLSKRFTCLYLVVRNPNRKFIIVGDILLGGTVMHTCTTPRQKFSIFEFHGSSTTHPVENFQNMKQWHRLLSWFASIVRIWNGMITINLAHYNLTFHL